MPKEIMKTVYIAMSADLVTPSHVQLIKEARKLGEVVMTTPQTLIRCE